MPRGSYLLAAGSGQVVERFSCAPGPAGWRYVATREPVGGGPVLGRLDVVLDRQGAVLRAQVSSGGWLLRGGQVGPELLWRRGDDERSERAAGFTGSSPAWAVAAARQAGTRPTPVRLRLVRLGDEALATSVVEQGWAGTGTTEHGAVPVSRFEVADLATGERAVVQLAGDVVVEAPGAVLLELEA